MKKKILVVILIIILIGIILGGMYVIDKYRMKHNKPVIFSTWGYSYTPSATASGENEQGYYFYGTVIEVYEKSVIVKPVEGSRELKSSDKISIGVENTEEYPVGTMLKITYNGIIMETYPAKINAIKVEFAGTVSINGEENNTNDEEKVIISHNEVKNIERLNNFADNVIEKKVSDNVTIVSYTVEGDEIIKTLEYDKELEVYTLTVDNTKDKFASEEDRKITTKKYGDNMYNLEKETKDGYTHLVLKYDDTYRKNLEEQGIIICFAEPTVDVTICAYKLEK